jgi:hypothetical protein
VLAKQRVSSEKTMKKKQPANKRRIKRGTMRAEYRFDYSKAKPNRFAARMSKGTIAVVLDSDVAAVFQSSDAVNSLLRSVISAMPEPKLRHAGKDGVAGERGPVGAVASSAGEKD